MGCGKLYLGGFVKNAISSCRKVNDAMDAMIRCGEFRKRRRVSAKRYARFGTKFKNVNDMTMSATKQ